MKIEDLKVGDLLIMEAFGKKLEVPVKRIDLEGQQFIADFGPIPFSSLPMLRKKTEKD